MKLAVTGKGGAGKTTIAGTLARVLARDHKRRVLALDADSNPNLAASLGIARDQIAQIAPLPSDLTEWREDETGNLGLYELAERLQKTPVEVQDFPGFAVNRVLVPMINEAVYCVMEGVAEPADVDTAMKLGTNQPMGPLELADLIGLDTCLHVMEVLHEGFGDTKYRPCPLLKRYVAAGRLGRKSGRGFFEYDQD